MFFRLELPKILSIFFEIVTSDDMQDDASDMLRLKLGQKLIFWLILRGFLFMPPEPYELRPKT